MCRRLMIGCIGYTVCVSTDCDRVRIGCTVCVSNDYDWVCRMYCLCVERL